MGGGGVFEITKQKPLKIISDVSKLKLSTNMAAMTAPTRVVADTQQYGRVTRSGPFWWLGLHGA